MKKKLPPFIEKFAKLDEELYSSVSQISTTAFADNGLDNKIKLLIALAIDASKGSSAGVQSLAKQAREAGATETEIKQTIRIAYYVVGMETLAAGSAAFSEDGVNSL